MHHHPNYTLLSSCQAPQKVIDAVRRFKPRHLYVSLDGDCDTYARKGVDVFRYTDGSSKVMVK